MRRKSERNKAKASPDKKAEKPTRKSTRRRGRRSPSTSPDRESSNDAATLSSRDKDVETTKLIRPSIRDPSTLDDIPENKVTSTETSTKQMQQSQSPSQPQQLLQPEETEDAGSVWKVARADASPGEIQKLKLCRQRNMSETSDASSSRKITNRWHEGGEGATEEVDSADEPSSAVSKNFVTKEEPVEVTNSVTPGRDSSEEVSDSKEIPPETSTAELSDDKPNIDDDRRGETIVKPMLRNTVEPIDDNEPVKTESTAVVVATSTIDADGSNERSNDDETSKEDTSATIKILNIVEYPNNGKNDETSVIKDEDAKSSKQSSSEDDEKTREIREKVVRRSSDSSDSNDNEESPTNASRRTLSRTTSRRKHRDKYRDSSNSDTAESEDDSERVERSASDGKTEDYRKRIKITEEEPRDEIEPSRTPEIRSVTPTGNEAPTDVDENNEIKNEESKENEKSERLVEAIPETPIVQSRNNYKPAKVNLKRSFAGRISVDTMETKKEGTDNHANDLANQDKENDGSSHQVDPKSIPKKRRWGTILTPTDATPAFCVSTDSLKVLVPGAKPLSISEVRLSKDDDEDKERRGKREKRYSSGDGSGDHKTREIVEIPKPANVKKDSKGDNQIGLRRKISIIKDNTRIRSPSPPAAIPTSILLIRNLVRPFTLNQIRELLSRTGTIVENGFWMDRIKSKCFVEYSNEDQAFETRQALHGISWPVSNPKRLYVEYATKEDMALARELSKDQTILRKTEVLAVNDGWQQDWARDERPNAATKVTVVREWDLGKEDGQQFGKDKEREKKEHDKKRRMRSRSPNMEPHLPPPARKFKKKEDDPPPAKLLDDLFKKTKSTPCIYWLPLTNEQIVVKEEMRRQHMAEHARRLEEMRRAERNRDGRRRRSPRK